jgi:peptide deformylase
VTEGHAAGTIQHEQDHLDGILFPDITLPNGLMTWDAFEEYYKVCVPACLCMCG